MFGKALLTVTLSVFSIFSIAVPASAAQSQMSFDSVQTFGQSANNTVVDVAVDPQGNVYYAGYFEGELDFDPGTGEDIRTTNGARHAYFSKLEAGGDYGYTRVFGDVSNGERSFGAGAIQTIAVNEIDQVYIGGSYEGTVDFDATDGVDSYTDSDSGNNGFITRYDTAGNYLGTSVLENTRAPFSSNVTVADMLIDPVNERLLIAGAYSGRTDFDPSDTNEVLRTYSGDYNAYVLSLDYAGNYLDLAEYGQNGRAFAGSVALDSQQNVIVGGSYFNQADFDPDPLVEDLKTGTSNDPYVSKYTADLEYEFTHVMTSSRSTGLSTLSVDSADNIYLGGDFASTMDFDPEGAGDSITAVGASSAYLSSLTSTGEYRFTKTFGTRGGFNEVRSMDHDAAGNLFLTGDFYNCCGRTLDIDPEGSGTYTTDATRGAYVSRFDATGNFLDAVFINGGTTNIPYSLVAANARVYVGGRFTGSLDFDAAQAGEEATSSENANFLASFRVDTYYGLQDIDSTLAVESTDSNVQPSPGEFGILSGQTVPVRLRDSRGVILAVADVRFDADLSWSEVRAESDASAGRVLIKNLAQAPGVQESYTAFVPFVPDQDVVVLCPRAATLSETTPDCTDREILELTDSRVSLFTDAEQEYYRVTGLTGTGLILATQAEVTPAEEPEEPTNPPAPEPEPEVDSEQDAENDIPTGDEGGETIVEEVPVSSPGNDLQLIRTGGGTQ